MATPRLKEKILITGKVIVETGLLIGGSSSALEIGGTDKHVVRNPINKRPYIPGSSLKGKMRSLFELSRGQVGYDVNSKAYGPTLNPDHEAAQLFGFIKDRNNRENAGQQPSRLIVRDGELQNHEKLNNTELLYTEIKAENSIDRITAEANPRFFERVPRGAEFGLNMVINIFDGDRNGEQFLNWVFEAMKLVQDDYLGGCGSRGNGQISFAIKSVKRRSREFYADSAKETEADHLIPEALRQSKS